MIRIIVPAFNEGGRLRGLLPLIPPRLHGVPVATIVVSDGSNDDTERVAREEGATAVVLPTNHGKGAALKAGVRRAAALGFDFLVTMDGDGQHDPRDLERLVAPVVTGRCDLAIGSRYLLDPSRDGTPVNRFLVRRMLIARLRRALGRTFTDPCCGYRCFSREAMHRIRFQGDRYQSELEAVFDAAGAGLRIMEVPVSRIYRPGLSKMGARWGRAPGRVVVVSQYLATVRRKTRELREAAGSPASQAPPPAAGTSGAPGRRAGNR